MARITLERVWDQVKSLAPADQERLRHMLTGILGIEPTPEMEDEFERDLVAEGLIILPQPPQSPEPYPDFRPITAKGKPVSQSLVEERR